MKIHITSRRIDRALLREYSPAHGIWCAPLYWVPTYEMTVEGSGSFEVIRFGLSRSQSHYPKARRPCDVGVFAAHRISGPAWIDYTPHTTAGSIRGAVQLWKGRNFLIHEGPADRETAMGSYGCVEILDRDAWKKFVATVKPVALKSRIELIIDAAVHPDAELAVRDESVKKTWSHALYRNWKSRAVRKFELTESDVGRLLQSANDGRKITKTEAYDLYYIGITYQMRSEDRLRIGHAIEPTFR